MTDGLSVVHEIVNGNSFIIQQTPDLEKKTKTKMTIAGTLVSS